MAIASLEIEDARTSQPKSPKSLKYVFIGLLIAATGLLFMGVGRESKLYAPVRDRVGQLTSSALTLHSASLAALKQKFSSSDTSAADTDTTEKVHDDQQRIADNFPTTQMQLPSLYNVILSPLGEHAFLEGVPPRKTLLYDLSVMNVTSETNWEWKRSPLPPPQRREEQQDTQQSVDSPQKQEGDGSGMRKKRRKLVSLD